MSCSEETSNPDSMPKEEVISEKEVTSNENNDTNNADTEKKDVPNGAVNEHKFTFKKPTFSSKKPEGVSSKQAADESKKRKEEPVEKKVFTKSPAERLKEQSIPLPYKEPPWGGFPTKEYSLEVLKSGIIIDNVTLSSKSFYTVGRLDACDMILEHPSISRYHAIIQHRVDEERGLFVYDLGSTHGTTLNKLGLIPKTFYRLKVGHVIRFGGSTRMFIVQGPDDDQEEESKETVTELIQKRKEKLQKLESGETEIEDRGREKDGKKEETDTGINWGMAEDADEATDLADNPYALEMNEDLYVDDPKKTLRGWFEREGHELQYHVEEKGYAQFLCRVDLPVDVVSSGILTAEVMVKGKKKEAVIQCALEACRLLDQYGLLRQATHESKKRKKRDWEENDYYDSDEDNFLDRTGAVERKRENRMMQAGKIKPKAETYDSLKDQLGALELELKETEHDLENASKAEKEEEKPSDDVDALDAYMTSLKSNSSTNRRTKASLKMRLNELRKEETRLKRLLEIAKPAILPTIKPKKALPMIGSRKGHGSTGLKKVDASGKIFPTKEIRPVEKKKMTISIKGPFIPPEVEAALKEKEMQEGEVSTNSEQKTRTPEDNSKPHKEQALNGSSTTEKQSSNEGSSQERLSATEESSCEQFSVSEELCHEEQSVKEKQSLKELSINVEPTQERLCLSEGSSHETVAENNDSNLEKQSNSEKVMSSNEEFVSSKEGTSAKRKRQRQRNRNEDTKRKSQQKFDTFDPNYDVWVPPQNQSGDGRTSLNDKLGY